MIEKEEGKTSILMQLIKKEITQLEKMLKKIDKFQKTAPEGTLKVQSKDNSTYFYQQCWDRETKQYSRKYINRESLLLAKSLAQKQYYTLIQPVLEQNLGILKRFAEQYRPNAYEKIYEGLTKERKQLVTPMLGDRELQIRQWQEEIYEKNDSYAENLRYETEQGEVVRSKSEVIIANILYQHRNNILYKYERPLEVVSAGRTRIIYPDFTVINLRTGKIIYWEHAGMMDDLRYANEFVNKVNTYVENDILPGRDVVFSFETMENSLEISVIKKMVEELENRCD